MEKMVRQIMEKEVEEGNAGIVIKAVKKLLNTVS
jgi:hypothetical protein